MNIDDLLGAGCNIHSVEMGMASTELMGRCEDDDYTGEHPLDASDGLGCAFRR